MNDAEQRDCLNCGHDAHAPRSQCRCTTCSTQGIQTTQAELRQVTQALARIHVERRGPVVPADKIEHLAAGKALQYVVYFGLTNWPDQYILREQDVHSDRDATTFVPRCISADLAKIRELIPPGYVNLGRSAVDAACVVEVWV